jgi:uncharacterized spore protein YtfJ
MTTPDKTRPEASTLPGELAEIFSRSAHAEAVFGQPVVQKGCSVVPVARAKWGLGGGRRLSGSRPGEGGGRLRVDPIGVVILRGRKARFQPIRPRRQRIEIGLALGVGLLLGLLFQSREPDRI